ncbi:MAG: helix-turn-helix transcriptional regulator [Caldisericales bacterium]|nr:helix-turn-helix transcriptional regulator [Caldisericales bacterium]
MRTTGNNFSLEGGLKALAEPTRLTILALLSRYDQLCVGQLVDALGLPQAGVSQHLRVLRYQGIVKVEREGQWAYYAIVPERISQIAKKVQDITKGDYQIPKDVVRSLETSAIEHPRNTGKTRNR